MLIVPYGIETCTGTFKSISIVVLIVPYGIETTIPGAEGYNVEVLIVPYGIETHSSLSPVFTTDYYSIFYR